MGRRGGGEEMGQRGGGERGGAGGRLQSSFACTLIITVISNISVDNIHEKMELSL